MRLPQAPWLDHEGLAGLAAVLGAGEGLSRYVGGAVRDTLLGLDVSDVDIATRLTPPEVIDRLRAAGIKAVPTGVAHGTVTAVIASGPVEVTTLRRDVATDGRHAVVAFSDQWGEDAARRDFTVNALYADPVTLELHDHHGGLADLSPPRIRFIGDPLRRIAEDHLRILRFFRFHARFGDAIDEQGLAACTERANDLMALSRERVAAEMLKLLVARDAVPVVRLMVDRAILRPVLPEITPEGVERLDLLSAREAESGVAPDGVRRLAALVPPQAAEAVGARLKLSNPDRKRLAAAAAAAGSGGEGPRALAYRHGPAIAIDRLLLSGEPVDAVKDWTPPPMPLTGGALVARGLAKGPDVARTLKRLESRWIAAGFPPAVPDDWIDQEVATAISA